MVLSIITINRNNAVGLEKTIRSVAHQTCGEFEYVIIDGASTDNSVEVIKSYEKEIGSLQWLSEPDTGIYNAMNKGIKMARGKYIQILNSGDCLASDDVTERMLANLEKVGRPSILYGNMIKAKSGRRDIVDKCFAGKDITLYGMYTGTLNHSPAYISRDLFDKYGYYDESLKIVSDWKWYLEAIVLGDVRPIYTDINVTLFDMTGISETNIPLLKEERRRVLEALIPMPVLSDYDRYFTAMSQYERLKRHPWAYKMTWLLERVLFKIERWQNRIKRVSSK